MNGSYSESRVIWRKGERGAEHTKEREIISSSADPQILSTNLTCWSLPGSHYHSSFVLIQSNLIGGEEFLKIVHIFSFGNRIVSRVNSNVKL